MQDDAGAHAAKPNTEEMRLLCAMQRRRQLEWVCVEDLAERQVFLIEQRHAEIWSGC